MFPPSCRHGRRVDDLHFTFFELVLAAITLMDIIVLTCLSTRCRREKMNYELLSKRVDETVEDLKTLRDTTTMQTVVPLMYLRKIRKSQEETAVEDAMEDIGVCDTQLSSRSVQSVLLPTADNASKTVDP
ncbi:unnamed protein product [Angiostrongylus costaricensis]|uniref:Transmembrane protein n=1 Tax=Angiostrongylus costaricensis TaxID=334426 RepID=A0A0R3PA66_ANGCS|nr:unnamed protein product [Angiostrongylus costaricensis]